MVYCRQLHLNIILCPRMTFENDRRKKLFKENILTFINEIDPKEILPYLKCLNPTAEQEILREQDNHGQRHAVFCLHKRLVQMDNWWQDFTEALKHPDINKPGLALLIDPSAKKRKKRRKKMSELKESKVYEESTLYSDLPESVRQVLRLLDGEPQIRNWEALAAELGYTVHDVQLLRCPSSDSSPISKLMADWSTKSESTLGNLLKSLRAIGRQDIITQIEDIVFNHHDDRQSDKKEHRKELTTCSSEKDFEKDGCHGYEELSSERDTYQKDSEFVTSRDQRQTSETYFAGKDYLHQSTGGNFASNNNTIVKQEDDLGMIKNKKQTDSDDKIHDGMENGRNERTASKFVNFGPWFMAGGFLSLSVVMYLASRKA